MKIQTEWDLSSLIKDESEVGKKLERIKQANESFEKKWKERRDYLESPEILKEALDDYENLHKFHGSSGAPGFYFHLKSHKDQTDTETKAKLNKVEEFAKEMNNKNRFFILNIAKIQKNEQKKFLQNNKLKVYSHFLETIFESAEHNLSENEEKIMSLKGTVAHDFWERLTQGLLSKQEREVKIENKKETKSFAHLLSLTESTDKKIREEAAKILNEILLQYSEVAEPEINAIVTNHKINCEIRKFPRADSPRHLEDDISTKTVDSLIKAVTEKFHISKDFYKLKAKLFKVPKIKYYERAVPYKISESSYSFEEAYELAHKTFSKLDKEFVEIFERLFINGQVDVFPKKGKYSSAFCSHLLPTQPTFVLLNHENNLKNITVIAHEFGHAINAELMNKKQNSLNIGTPKSTAEVASTFMEDFVLDELLANADDERKLEILIEKLSGDISSTFRQVAFYNFETELHVKIREKGFLSKEEIGEMFKKHMNSYLGEAVDVSEAENWWVYIPHFRYIFYVYSYASGLLISKSLQRQYKKNKEFITKIKEFLSAGTSDSPERIFKNLGLDITKKEFWDNGLNEFEDLLEKTEELAKKLQKI